MKEWHNVLSEVSWRQVKSLQGDCVNIPVALKNLSSEDAAVRKNAYWSLDNHVVVQGGLMEGAFFATPFLVQSCVASPGNGCVEALTVLYEIANGSASFESVVLFRQISTPFTYYVPNVAACSLPLTVAVRGAIGRELLSFVSLAAHEADDVRGAAQELLLSFPEYAFGLSQHLNRIAEGLSRGPIKASVHQLVSGLQR